MHTHIFLQGMYFVWKWCRDGFREADEKMSLRDWKRKIDNKAGRFQFEDSEFFPPTTRGYSPTMHLDQSWAIQLMLNLNCLTTC